MGAACMISAMVHTVGYGAELADIRSGDIVKQILDLNHGPVDKIIVAEGNNDAFDQAVRMRKPGGTIGDVNDLGEGDDIKLPRESLGFGMGHKKIVGGLMPGGRPRSEKLARLVLANRIHPEKLITHRFQELECVEEALMPMKDKPRDLMKHLVIV